MSTLDIRLLAIAGPPVTPLERVVAACRAAEQGGATAVQLRAKAVPAGELLRLTEELVRALSVAVFVNDRADVAWLADARGVHLGADDVPPSRVRVFAPAPFVIGASVGNPDEAVRAATAAVDYWSVGPIFATSTKPDAGAPIGLAGFRALAARAPAGMPVIGIGGIDARNAPGLLEAGAAGVAVSHAIFGAPDVARAARALRDAVDGARQR